MLSDGIGQFAKALGVELDLADKGLGLRSRRYAMLVEDQVGRCLVLCEQGNGWLRERAAAGRQWQRRRLQQRQQLQQ